MKLKIALIVVSVILAALTSFYFDIEQCRIEKIYAVAATLFSFLSGFVFLIYTKAGEFAIKFDARSDREIKEQYKVFLDNLKKISNLFYLYILSIIFIILYTTFPNSFTMLVTNSAIGFSFLLSFTLPHMYESVIRQCGESLLIKRNS